VKSCEQSRKELISLWSGVQIPPLAPFYKPHVKLGSSQGEFVALSLNDDPASPKIGTETGSVQNTKIFPVTNGVPYDVLLEYDQTTLHGSSYYYDHGSETLLGSTNGFPIANDGADRVTLAAVTRISCSRRSRLITRTWWSGIGDVILLETGGGGAGLRGR
jgi:hypothetical protein